MVRAITHLDIKNMELTLEQLDSLTKLASEKRDSILKEVKKKEVELADIDKTLFERKAMLFDIPKIRSEIASLQGVRRNLNEDILTQQEKAEKNNWVAQREVLMKEVSLLRDEKLKLEKTNKELADSHTHTITQINKVEGRIDELNKKETEYESVIDMELAQKIIKKTSLENQIPALEKQVDLLESQKNSLIESIQIMQSVNSGFAAKNIDLEKQIGGVILLAEKNIGVVNSLMESLKVSTKELIDINTKNVKETNIVINQLPRMVVELQKHGLIKKI
jgi:chromosome segregation ATPase